MTTPNRQLLSLPSPSRVAGRTQPKSCMPSVSGSACNTLVKLLSPSYGFLQMMQPRMGSFGHYLKVLKPVIKFVAILMMHDFIRTNQPSKQILCHKPMFGNIAQRVAMWVGWHANCYVPIAKFFATTPVCPTTSGAAAGGTRFRTIHSWCRASVSKVSSAIQACCCDSCSYSSHFASTATRTKPIRILSIRWSERLTALFAGILVGHQGLLPWCHASGCIRSAGASRVSHIQGNFIMSGGI